MKWVFIISVCRWQLCLFHVDPDIHSEREQYIQCAQLASPLTELWI